MIRPVLSSTIFIGLMVSFTDAAAHSVTFMNDIYPLEQATKALDQDVRTINETLRVMQERIELLEKCLQLDDAERRTDPSCDLK